MTSGPSARQALGLQGRPGSLGAGLSRIGPHQVDGAVLPLGATARAICSSVQNRLSQASGRLLTRLEAGGDVLLGRGCGARPGGSPAMRTHLSTSARGSW